MNTLRLQILKTEEGFLIHMVQKLKLIITNKLNNTKPNLPENSDFKIEKEYVKKHKIKTNRINGLTVIE